MAIDTHTSTTPVSLDLLSVAHLHLTSNGSPEQRDSPSARPPSTRAFVPLTPILASPLVTPVVASPSIPDRLGPSTGHTGLDINGVPTAVSTDHPNRRGSYSTATINPPLAQLTAPPTWVSIPPTPPRFMNPQQSVMHGSTFQIRPLSLPPVYSFTGSTLSTKSSLSSTKSFSHLPRDPLYSSSSCRSLPAAYFPWQVPSQSPYPTLKDRRAKKRLAASSLAGDAVIDAFTLHSVRKKPGKSLFHVGSDTEDAEPAFQISSVPQRRPKKFERITELDGVRRYHALMELLRTEAKYLFDLRTLVTVYLQQLPMATTSARISATSYFASSTALNAVSKALPYHTTSSLASTPLPMNAIPTVGTPLQYPAMMPIGASTMSRRRSHSVTSFLENGDMPQRRLFSDEDVALLSRNARQLLEFHDRFMKQIKEAIGPFGPSFAFSFDDAEDYSNLPTNDSLDHVIEIMMSKFINEATVFHIYQSFCSTHTEACELIQKTKKQYPIEWAMWEKRCGSLAEDMHYAEAVATEALPPGPSTMSNMRQSFNRSEFQVECRHPKRPRSTPSFVSSTTHSKATVTPTAAYSPSVVKSQSSRLMFTDYLIKPVQRICQYHLLLDQLKVKKPNKQSGTGAFHEIGSQTDALVARASDSMRSAVDSVNDDRRRHEYHFKSLLIASRMGPYSPLSPEFLRSLGACLLAGALDVIYHRPSTSAVIKAKYLGIFLYVGGYLVMTKVVKGRMYDPFHWFPLNGFEVIDQKADHPGFPYSFRLVGQGHHFNFAAACQKEKEVWMEGLRESVDSIPGWTMEPVSSLRDENKEVFLSDVTASCSKETTLENPAPLPTIESLSELESTFARPNQYTVLKPQSSRRPRTLKRVSSESKIAISTTKSDITTKQDPSLSLSRSSTASAKAIFSPFLFDSGARISRCSSPQRQHVEQGLADVFSDLCRDARSLAEIRSVELFQMPKKAYHLGSAGNMRSKRENKLISRRSYAGTASTFAGDSAPRKQKTWPDTSHRRGSSMGATSDGDGSPCAENSTLPNSEIIPDYLPDPLSVCSYGGTSGGGSSTSSPTVPISLCQPPSPPVNKGSTVNPAKPFPVAESNFRPKRSQSMVDNFRSFFSTRTLYNSRPRSGAAPTSLNITQDWRGHVQDDTALESSPFSIRKRAQSTPIVPFEQSSSSAGSILASSKNSPCHQKKPVSAIRMPALDKERSDECFPGDSKTLHRKQSSFLKSYTRRDPARPADGSAAPTRRRSLKDILHYFRSNSFTPITA